MSPRITLPRPAVQLASSRLIAGLCDALIVALIAPSTSQAVDVCSTCTYKSINAAIGAQGSNPAGVTINVYVHPDGPYRELVQVSSKSGNPGNPFVIKAQGPVIIEGSKSYSMPSRWTQITGDSTFWTHDSSGIVMPPDWLVLVDNVPYQYQSVGTSWGDVHLGRWSYDATVSPKRIYINVGHNANPGDKATYIAERNRTLEVKNSNHVVIDGFTAQRSNDRGIEVYGSASQPATGVVIKNCVATRSRKYGISFERARRCSLQSNITSYNLDNGIHIARAESTHIVRNTSYGNDDPYAPRRACGINLGAGNDSAYVVVATLDYNTVYNNDDTGINLRGSRRILVRRNLSYGNGDHGYDNNGTDSTAFINNVAFRNDHSGLSVEPSCTSVSVYNSMFVHNGLDGSTLAPGSGNTNVCEMQVHGVSGFKSDHNVVVGLAPAAELTWSRFVVEYHDTTHTSFSAYRTLTHNLDESSYTGNPTFIDTVAANFRIVAKVPDSAIDAAKTDISGWTTMWLATDPDGRTAVDHTCESGGVGTPTYADIGVYERADAAPGGMPIQVSTIGVRALGIGWTAPGQDSAWCSSVTEVSLRYRRIEDGPITDANFTSNSSVTVPTPYASAGATQSVEATNLDSCQTYYVGLRSKDSAGNWSVLTTASASTGCGSGGGGGGGCNGDPNCYPESARLAEGYVATEQRITRAMTATGPINLSFVAGGQIAIDSLAVLEVVHGVDSLAVLSEKEIFVGALTAPSELMVNGSDIRALVDAEGYGVTAMDTLQIRFAATERVKTGTSLVIDIESAESSYGYVLVRVQDPDDGWRVISRVSPGEGRKAVAVDGIEADSLQLVFGDAFLVHGVHRVLPDARPAVLRTVALESARHSSRGDVPVPAGDASLVVGPGETLTLNPVTDAAPEGTVRERVLRYRVSSPGSRATRQTAVGRTPVEFALEQNQPNPFSANTAIRFALPVSSRVVLEVFDVRGRRIRSLARGEWKAGYHTLVWGGLDGDGKQAGPGIYLYRIEAGPFQASRKLIILP